MKKILDIYCKTNLIIKILIGLILGIILGLAVPNFTAISILGDMFVGSLKAIAPLLVFVLVISSLANANNGIGKQFRTVITLYMLSTFLAAFVAVISSRLSPITLNLNTEVVDTVAPMGIGDVFKTLVLNMVANPIKALSEANYVGILFWSVIIGLSIKVCANNKTKEMLQDISNSISKAVGWIINLAPFGIMGLVFVSVSENGIMIFVEYSKLIGVLLGAMLSVALIVDPLIVGICLRRNPYPLVFKCLKESGLTAFFTRSSAANIPINMALCEKFGLDKDLYSVSIPLGATINMNGAAITITIMSLAVANTLGIQVDLPTALFLSIVATLGACGSSGVAGGSLLLIPMACSLFGINNDIAMQAVGVGFIIGVIQDSLETAINSSADVLFATTAEFMLWKKSGKEIKF